MRFLAVAGAAIAGLLLPGTALAAPSDPSSWPAEAGRDPELTGTEDTVRFAGADRYQTNVALDLALRGRGGYPFTTADRTGDWWGAGSCPRSILVVAGDTFADALAAASLSDPTDRSDQPRLRRVASTDPVFNPPGALDRVDTAFAPIVVTESTRAGATALASSARFTAEDLVAGGCTTAREAIVVGGLGAVPAGVEAELVSLGYREVFRVAGADRYDTAAQVAEALGTGTPLDGACRDTDDTDHRVALGWHGNAVVEYRPNAHSCRLLPRAVVLADGDTGADALAAGWWTSYWQVPILLTAPDGSLPAATRDALTELSIDTLIVLGGTSRIPEATVAEARSLASATAGRVAGADRYETSVAMAHVFGGWWPTGVPADATGDRVCLAASGGSGPTATGWPDALAAGPFCSRLAAAGTQAPARVRHDATSLGGTPAHDATPILLTPPGSPSLPDPVRTALEAAFAPGTGSGFGIVLGGISAIPASVAGELGSLLTGFPNGVTAPAVRDTFATELDLSFVFSELGGPGRRICQERASVSGARWLATYGDVDRTTFLAQRDLYTDRLAGASVNLPFCLPLTDPADALVVQAVTPGGATADGAVVDLSTGTELSGPVRLDGRSSGNETRFTATGVPKAFVELRTPQGRGTVATATLDLQLSLTAGRLEFAGTAALRGLTQTVIATVRGEGRETGGVWDLRGRASLGSAVDGTDVVGGFTATITSTPSSDAVSASWQLDGFPTNAG